MKINKFLTRNINSSILSAQFDMRGYVHPLGGRMSCISSKSLSYVLYNLIAFAGGAGKRNKKGEDISMTIEPSIWFSYYDEDVTYEKVLFVCKKLSSECNFVNKEAIRFLIKDVLNKTEALKKEAVLKNTNDSYLRPLDKNSNQGKITLALMETFDVKEDEPVSIVMF